MVDAGSAAGSMPSSGPLSVNVAAYQPPPGPLPFDAAVTGSAAAFLRSPGTQAQTCALCLSKQRLLGAAPGQHTSVSWHPQMCWLCKQAADAEDHCNEMACVQWGRSSWATWHWKAKPQSRPFTVTQVWCTERLCPGSVVQTSCPV